MPEQKQDAVGTIPDVFHPQKSTEDKILDLLQDVVKKDPSLNMDERAELLKKLNDDSLSKTLTRGSIGSAIGLLLAKFFKMDKDSKTIMGLLGFGIVNALKQKLLSKKQKVYTVK